MPVNNSRKWIWINILGIGLTSAVVLGWWMTRHSEVDDRLAAARAQAQAGDIAGASKSYRELDHLATTAGVPRNRLGDIDAAREEWNQLLLAEINAASASEQRNDLKSAAEKYALVEQISAAGNVSPAMTEAVDGAMLRWERLFTPLIEQAEKFVKIGEPTGALEKYQELHERYTTLKSPPQLQARIKSAVDDWAGIYSKAVADARAAVQANDRELAKKKYDELKSLTDGRKIPATVVQDVQAALQERSRLF